MRFEDEQVQYSPGQNGEHLKGEEGILNIHFEAQET